VGKVKLSNKNTRKFINGIHYLIDDIFSKPEDEQQRDAWHQIFANYTPAMEILWKRSDYTAADIARFQDLIDSFFSQYINETGVEGINGSLSTLSTNKFFLTILNEEDTLATLLKRQSEVI
jgi:hypothetical protein